MAKTSAQIRAEKLSEAFGYPPLDMESWLASHTIKRSGRKNQGGGNHKETYKTANQVAMKKESGFHSRSTMSQKMAEIIHYQNWTRDED